MIAPLGLEATGSVAFWSNTPSILFKQRVTRCYMCYNSISTNNQQWSTIHDFFLTFEPKKQTSRLYLLQDLEVNRKFQDVAAELSAELGVATAPCILRQRAEAVPWELRGTKEFNQLRCLISESETWPPLPRFCDVDRWLLCWFQDMEDEKNSLYGNDISGDTVLVLHRDTVLVLHILHSVVSTCWQCITMCRSFTVVYIGFSAMCIFTPCFCIICPHAAYNSSLRYFSVGWDCSHPLHSRL